MRLFDALHSGNRQDSAYPRYVQWNQALGRRFFHEGRAGEVVRLVVEPGVLLEAMEEECPDQAPSNESEAKQDFVAAVEAELAARKNQWAPRNAIAKDTYPDFLGLLALQVLAVLELGDELRSGRSGRNQLWNRVNDLIPQAGRVPNAGFNKQHQKLWRDGLAQWANEVQGGRWGRVELPPDGGYWEAQRHVKLPYSQAVLRSLDIEALSEVFTAIGLRPGGDFDKRAFLAVLDDAHVRRLLSKHARAVFGDRLRASTAVAQAAEAYSHWDGSGESLAQRQVSRSPRRVELCVSVLAGNPAELRLRLESLNSTAASPLSQDKVQQLLGEGIGRVSSGGLRFRPRRRDFLLAVRDETRNTCITQGKVARGESGLLVCLARDAAEWTRTAADAGVKGVERFAPIGEAAEGELEIAGLSLGWRLLTFSLSKHMGEAVPSPWDRVVDHHCARLRLAGGVRLRRGAWLAGAGPRVEVVGNPSVKKLLVDGTAYCPVVDGAAEPVALNEPGKHVVMGTDEGPEITVVRLLVREAEVSSERLSQVGAWVFTEDSWPIFHPQIDREDHKGPYVIGMRLNGDPDPASRSREVATSPSRRLLELLVSPDSHARASDATSHPVVAAVASNRVLELST